jgi:uncharacterized protein YggE
MLKTMLRAVMAIALCASVAASVRAQETTVRGRLGRTVEAGGWLVVAAKQKYLVINASKWKDETWFHEGAEVEATGAVRKDVVTTQMEGVPFEASSMRVVGAATSGEGDGASSGQTNQQSNQQQLKLMGTTRVVVAGESVVHARPDTANVTVAVVTQGQTALAAQTENARKTDAVVRAVKTAMGAGAQVETSGYSLQPQYVYRQNESPLIQGYQARNAVTVTLSDLTRVGGVIDAATSAGANNVEGLTFSLREDRAARDESLAAATREALREAQIMAQALGGRVLRVVEVQESSTGPRPVPIYKSQTAFVRAEAEAQQTPVETGTLDVRAQVQLVAEIGNQQ